MSQLATELTKDQIANRRKVIRALKRSKRQCFGNTFEGTKVCAIGVAVRCLLGIRNEDEWAEYEKTGDSWVAVRDLLGLPSCEVFWHMNDRLRLTLPAIGAELERQWFG